MLEIEKRYWELVDSLCSPSWLGRNRHASVCALARRLRDAQARIYPTAERIARCTRIASHGGPCNGLQREDCIR